MIYLTGTLVTCRAFVTAVLSNLKRPIPYHLNGKAISTLAPSCAKRRQMGDGLGRPTTSMRTESSECEFIEQAGVELVVGRGAWGR
ncbi:fumarate hydratase C-terminal domain-containing protein [Shigella flexneri]